MERLLIILAVLVCAAAVVAVVAMGSRGRRPPLRMHSELDEGDEHFLLRSVGAPESPIDRSAQVLDAHAHDGRVVELEPVEAPRSIEGRAGMRDEGRPAQARPTLPGGDR